MALQPFGPWPLQETPTPELMTARISQISGSEKKQVLETAQNSKRDNELFRSSEQELA
jgi:hypothetical protein